MHKTFVVKSQIKRILEVQAATDFKYIQKAESIRTDFYTCLFII